MAAPPGTKAHGQELPIVVGQVVDTSSKKGVLVVAWFLPQLARVVNFRGVTEEAMVDVVIEEALSNSLRGRLRA